MSPLHTFLTRHRKDPGVTGSETVTAATAGARRVPRPVLALAALVLVSTAVRFAVAQTFTTPWIAPDEIVYGMLGEGLWSRGTLTLRELPTPYYSLLTPALIGGPLAVLDRLQDGIQWARLLQALAMSLVAVPTYLWARRIVSTRWSLGAAALVLMAPALHYTGFLMTEPLTLTVVTTSLYALARAIETPSLWRYGVFVAWATAAAAVRLQALVLLPAFLVAALVDALAARDPARLRPVLRFTVIAGSVTIIVCGLLILAGGDLSTRRLLGAYTPVGDATGASADRLAAIAWHALDVAILGLGVAALTTAAVVWVALAGRDRSPALRAFVSVTVAYIGLLVVQVGLFSAVFVGSVAERYLLTALPLVVVGLCIWCARGAPRAPAFVVAVWAASVLGALLVPIPQIASSGTLPNTLTPAALGALSNDYARLALVAAALAAGVLVLFLPRRVVWVAPVLVAAGLVLTSTDAARRIADASAHEQRVTIGSEAPTWLDDAGITHATLLVTGDRSWPATARTVFWNRAIDEVVRVVGAVSSFPPVAATVEIDPRGVIRRADGEPLERDVLVTPSTVTLRGEKLAERAAGDSETYGLVAWRPDGPTRVALRTAGFLPNGDFTGTATIAVYGCVPGTLDVTVLGKTGDPVEARVDGIPVAQLETPNEEAVTHRIPAPTDADGSRACVFELDNPGYAGTTTIVFTPE
jgi:hypothetical protein